MGPQRRPAMSAVAPGSADLGRLYARREALDNLIRSLERYQSIDEARKMRIPGFIAGRTCWSGCAQSRT